ncbi:MAG: acyl-CoA dehydrogenase family protein [Acidobacteria bacterium]|nr:acyl-CoA dehydrogenase family protein [Acidobacteriota bacterium]
MTDDELVDQRLDELLAQFPDLAAADVVAFRGAQFDLGLAFVHFERGFGGLGLAAGLQLRIDSRLREVGAPPRNNDYIGMHQGAASIDAVGTPEQKGRFLRPLFTGEEHWCQLFSEPGAGSDLAGLATMAVRDGDEWIVNGQKVWTSGAHESDFAILVARTNPDAPKHRGLTFFICDIKAPGVEIRPLRQADGRSHFNEVFLTDVRIPDGWRLGNEGHGWGISLTGLHSEREGIGDAFSRPIETLLDLWRGRDDRTSAYALALRDRAMQAWVDSKVVELNGMRMRAALGRGGATPLGSLAKVAHAELNQRLSEIESDLMGPAAQVGLDYDALLRGEMDEPASSQSPQLFAVRSRAMSIEGGTSEIQRNIVGERVLGLPGDIRVDKDRPWREVPRN